MRIVHVPLWDSYRHSDLATQFFFEPRRAWLVYVPPEMDGYTGRGAGGYMLTRLQPIQGHVIVATNAPGFLPHAEARSRLYLVRLDHFISVESLSEAAFATWLCGGFSPCYSGATVSPVPR